MFKHQKRNFINNILFSRAALAIFGLLIIIAISFPLSKNISRRYKINQEIKDLEQEIRGLENKNFELKKLIGYLESDQFTQEQARLNMNYKKEGEEVVVIQNKDEQLMASGRTVVDINDNIKAREISNPMRWWHYFFKINKSG